MPLPPLDSFVGENTSLPPLDSFVSTDATNTPPSEPNYFSRTGADYSKAGEDILAGVEAGANSYQKGVDQANNSNNIVDQAKGVLSATGGLVESGLNAAGKVAGAAFAPITEFPPVKYTLEEAGKLINHIQGVKDTIDTVKKLAEKHPEIANDVGNIVNILSLGTGKAVEEPVLAAAKATAKETGAIASDIVGGAKSVFAPTQESLDTYVSNTFDKAIKPSIAGKRTIGQLDAYKLKALDAIKTIADNKDNLTFTTDAGVESARLPQSISEFAQSIDQTKKNIYQQYNDLAQRAGKAGAEVDTKSIAGELDSVINNKALQISHPSAVEYAQSVKDRLTKVGKIDAVTAEQVIQNYNSSLQAFYRNPTYESASKVAIDAGVANNFRQALDKVIENTTGEEYQALKNKYGSLKTIENDVVRASIRDAKKANKGLIDYTDIFSGGDIATGILTLNPALFTKGVAERGIKEWIKFLNNPNRAVSKMFEKAEAGPAAPFQPKSKLGNLIDSAAPFPIN